MPEPPRHDETASLRASLEEHQKALEAWKQSHAQLEERLAQAGQPAPAEDDPRVAELEAERAALQAELAEAQKPAPVEEDSRLPALEAERDALKGERDSLKAELAEAHKPVPPVEDPRVAELEAERAALQAELADAQKPAPPVDDPRLNQLLADRESLQAELGARDSLIEDLKASRAKVETARTELEQALAREVERSATVRAELAAPAPEPAGRWDAAESHLVFFQGPDGYELVERSGPPPSEGSSIDAQIVARVASAPIPGSALPCAYLVS